VSVADYLACLSARSGEAKTISNVVQPALQLLKQDVAGHALGARSFLK